MKRLFARWPTTHLVRPRRSPSDVQRRSRSFPPFHLWFALLVWASSSGVLAQASSHVSRGSAVERAMRDNPQVAASRAAVAQAEARRGQASAARFPAVSVVLGTGPSLKAELVPGTAVESTEDTYGDVGLSDMSIAIGGQLEIVQPLYTFGKIGHRAQAAQHEIRARNAQAEMTRADVGVSVAGLYEGLLFARDAERFFDETSHWLARTIEDTRNEIEAGTGATEQDLLRLQAARGAIQIALNQAATSRRQAEAGLVAYLGLPARTSLSPEEQWLELLPTPPADAGPMIRMALDQRPELRALSEGSAAYHALAQAEAAGNLPDLFAMAFLFGGYTPGRDVVDTRYVRDPLNGFYPGVLVGARWQWTAGMADRRADENEAKARELAHTRRWARAGLPAEVQKAFEDVQRAKRDADESERTVKNAKRWLVQASADYSVGLGESDAVTDAAQAYVQLRIAHFDAKFRHNVALADLARATGTLSSPRNPFYPNH
ncbi:MAG: TolC family protein [Myxococcales bacterium]|nr:TolC family protein [Myxococcales bacterium]